MYRHNEMMAQIVLKYHTMDRIEKITGKKFTHGGDRLINEVLDKLESYEYAKRD